MDIVGTRGEKHCGDLSGDRRLGEYWERQFCVMMAERGKTFTPHQIGRQTSASAWSKTDKEYNHFTLPDVTIWTSPGEHHEIKHKNATKSGRFGLEHYRLDALVEFARETNQLVLYTIHDHKGNRDDKTNRPDDWLTISVLRLLTATKQDDLTSGNRPAIL